MTEIIQQSRQIIQFFPLPVSGDAFAEQFFRSVFDFSQDVQSSHRVVENLHSSGCDSPDLGVKDFSGIASVLVVVRIFRLVTY